MSNDLSPDQVSRVPSNDLLRTWAVDPENEMCWGLDTIADERESQARRVAELERKNSRLENLNASLLRQAERVPSSETTPRHELARYIIEKVRHVTAHDSKLIDIPVGRAREIATALDAQPSLPPKALLEVAWRKYGRHLHDCQRHGQNQCTCGFVETCVALRKSAETTDG